MSYLEWLAVIDCDEKVNADHRGHTINWNLEEFWQEKMCELESKNRSRLDQSRVSRREIFTCMI